MHRLYWGKLPVNFDQLFNSVRQGHSHEACWHMRWIDLATGFDSQRQKVSKTPWPKYLGLHWSFLMWYFFTTCVQMAVKS